MGRCGKYSNCWNISNNDGQRLSINLSKIKQWEISKEPDTKSKNQDDLSNRLSSLSLNEIRDDETQIHETLIATNKSQQLEAKMIKFNQRRNQDVYDEIGDLGQRSISLRWVMKEKVVKEKKIIKARLCARGFEEEQNFRTDSLTCSREGI